MSGVIAQHTTQKKNSSNLEAPRFLSKNKTHRQTARRMKDFGYRYTLNPPPDHRASKIK